VQKTQDQNFQTSY